MIETGLDAALAKLRDAGASEPAVAVFTDLYRQVSQGATGQLPEAEIEAIEDVEGPGTVDDDAARAALAATAVLKLNGGLGTSMGLQRAKTLLTVRDGHSFLDVIARQVLRARERFDVAMPLLLMTSFRTHDDTLAALAGYPELTVDGLPLAFGQNQVPKLRADDLTPVAWPANPELEWCPPGHGDLFTVLHASGLVERLLERGLRYLSISNGDNLGAAPDGALAAWFAASGAPFAMEVCRRSVNDRKGGHIARGRDGRLLLRELAMVVPGEEELFTDADRHRFFNTNNLWLDLAALRDALAERGGVLGLPLIRNAKTVDPNDPTSTPVLQLETGMGTAVSVFDGARAVLVDRSRFLPVKTTNELALLRSSLFELTDDFELRRTGDGPLPAVELDKRFYGGIAGFDARLSHPLDLRDADALRVRGDWTFGEDVAVSGSVELADTGLPQRVADGSRLAG